MAYKQSPFPLIQGTSPVKSLGLLKAARHAIKYGIKGAKYIKAAFSKSPFGPPTKGKQILPKSKSAHIKGTYPKGKRSHYNPKIHTTQWPGKMSTQHPNWLKWASEQAKADAKFNASIRKSQGLK